MLTFSFQLYKGRINATSHVIQHPMYGAGHKFRTLHLPVSTTLAEVLDRVSGKLRFLVWEFLVNFVGVFLLFNAKVMLSISQDTCKIV